MRAEDRSAYLDDLDRLVDAELQVLITHLRRRLTNPPRPAESGDEQVDRDNQPVHSNVVRAHPLARRPLSRPRTPSPTKGLFAPDETAFLANAADWLRGRPNADILLDALTRSVMAVQDHPRDFGDNPSMPAAKTKEPEERDAAFDDLIEGGPVPAPLPEVEVEIDPVAVDPDLPEADRPEP